MYMGIQTYGGIKTYRGHPNIGGSKKLGGPMVAKVSQLDSAFSNLLYMSDHG